MAKRNDYEHKEQANVNKWVQLHMKRYPELENFTAIPMGGLRNYKVAIKLKAEGVKAGYPDMLLDVARQGYHGLRIELKYGKNKTSPKQDRWIKNLKKEGYRVEVCYGWIETVNVIKNYLGIK